MNIFGMGGFEILLIGAIALFVLGPKRLLEGIREGRRIYSDLKRQRDALQSMITEAIDLEDLKKQVDAEGLADSLAKDVKGLEDELALDQVADDIKISTSIDGGPVPRTRQLKRPPIGVDSEMRNAIPDLKLPVAAEGDVEGSEGAGPDAGKDADAASSSDAGASAGADEVKS
ncbi:MAG: hypothetical protein QF357_08390 [Dehalococcoidia bacterium]|jgi:Sec-independent protein translocase protein TatA|nr:hypothetical protein [Dehalococcoidia bacterium]